MDRQFWEHMWAKFSGLVRKDNCNQVGLLCNFCIKQNSHLLTGKMADVYRNSRAFLFPTFLTSRRSMRLLEVGYIFMGQVVGASSTIINHTIYRPSNGIHVLKATTSSHICYENIPFGYECNILWVCNLNQLLVFDNNKVSDTLLSHWWISSVFTANYFIPMVLKQQWGWFTSGSY